MIGFPDGRRTPQFSAVRAPSPAAAPRSSGKGDVSLRIARGREVRVGTFPISIDFREFETRAGEDGGAREGRSLRDGPAGPQNRSGDRSARLHEGDPAETGGVSTALLASSPSLPGASRSFRSCFRAGRTSPGTSARRSTIERLVGEINGEFTRSGWVPIHYIYRNLDWAPPARVLPCGRRGARHAAEGRHEPRWPRSTARPMRASDGVLVLSEFAGAAAQLQRGATSSSIRTTSRGSPTSMEQRPSHPRREQRRADAAHAPCRARLRHLPLGRRISRGGDLPRPRRLPPSTRSTFPQPGLAA